MTEVLQKLVVYPDGTEKYIPLSAEELAQRELDEIAWAERQAAEAAAAEALAALKASAKAKLIAGEPLTPEEAETIVL